MTARPLLARGPGTRLARRDTAAVRLETLGAEFALLAQRRARLSRQITLLDRQRDAALHDLSALERRLATLARRMTASQPVGSSAYSDDRADDGARAERAKDVPDALPNPAAAGPTAAGRSGRRVFHQY